MKKKVLAIMLVAMSIMLISACGKKENLYEIPDLSQYKDRLCRRFFECYKYCKRSRVIRRDTHMIV